MSHKAAQYVRMSTDEQAGSIEIQKTAIARYAGIHGFEIVATYADEGKSGLSVGGRGGMRQLLSDVLQVSRAFDTVLVLDVSRWGRFQDVDESAYYEYHCRKNGVQVVYVAEAFPTSGRPMDGVLKHIKRVMAAEYIRELALKVAAGQERVVRLGYVSSGVPYFGFQRLAVTADNQPRRILETGERKPQLTDRVRWIPGPPREVALVQSIFDLFVHTRMTTWQLADRLAAAGHRNRDCKPFTRKKLRQMLGNPIYCGEYIWRTGKPRYSRWAGPERSPIRVTEFVEPIVAPELWQAAHAKLAKVETRRPAPKGPTKLEVTERLREALATYPNLGSRDVASANLPTLRTFKKLFGGFVAANRAAAGRSISQSKGTWQARRLEGMALVARVLQDLACLLIDHGFRCGVDGHERMIVLADSGFKMRLMVAHPQGRTVDSWRVKIQSWHDGWLLLMRQRKSGIARDFFLLPPLLSKALGTTISEAEFESLGEYQLRNERELVERIGCVSTLSLAPDEDLQH